MWASSGSVKWNNIERATSRWWGHDIIAIMSLVGPSRLLWNALSIPRKLLFRTVSSRTQRLYTILPFQKLAYTRQTQFLLTLCVCFDLSFAIFLRFSRKNNVHDVEWQILIVVLTRKVVVSGLKQIPVSMIACTSGIAFSGAIDFSIALVLNRAADELEWITAVFGREAGYTLVWLRDNHWKQRTLVYILLEDCILVTSVCAVRQEGCRVKM